jgi:exopolysaccharide biosynthesis polyprenyl glycosylphosphotransferase
VSSLTDFANLEDVVDAKTVRILERRRARGESHRRGWLVRRALLVADVVGLTGAFALAEVVYAEHVHQAGVLSPFVETATFAFSLPLWIVAIKVYGLYDNDEERANHSTADDFARIFHLITVCTFVLFAGSRLTMWFNPEFWKLFTFWLIAILGTTSLRGAVRAYCRGHIAYLQNTVIVGAGDVGQTIARKLLKHPEYGINLVGFVDDEPRVRHPGLEHLAILGGHNDLIDVVELLDVERVIIAFSSRGHETALEQVRMLSDRDVQVDVVPRLFEVMSPALDLHSIEGVVMCGLRPFKLSRSSRTIKRALDCAASAAGLLALVPLFVAVGIAIKIDSPGPVFFRQERRGERGRMFTIWKFRSMSYDAEVRKQEFAHLNKHLAPGGDPRMFKIECDPRVTRVGAFLRRWSLDELPQLINVLLGDMSLVGPRPLIPEEHRHVGSWAARRLDLRPGITGLWQVLGRDDISFDEMVKLDYLYATSWSMGSDFRLLLRTLPTVVRSR